VKGREEGEEVSVGGGISKMGKEGVGVSGKRGLQRGKGHEGEGWWVSHSVWVWRGRGEQAQWGGRG